MELSAERLCDRLANRCLSHTRGADKAKDLALNRTLELTNRNEFENSLFNLIHTVMRLVKNEFRLLYVIIVLCRNTIWKLSKIFEISSCYLNLAVMLFHSQEPVDFFFDHLHNVIGNRLPFKVG
jgi:hypothetical protein